jgi:hypothetical protein
VNIEHILRKGLDILSSIEVLGEMQFEQAVTDYRAKHGISAEIVDIDGTGVLWRK